VWVSIPAVKDIYTKSFAPHKILIRKRRLKVQIGTPAKFSLAEKRTEEGKFQRSEVTSKCK
jgi:hypothetical protein